MSLEFLGNRTLRNVINESGGLAENWLSVMEFGLQVCSIVDYMHNSIGLFQLDLEPDNFAVNSDKMLKLMDLGSAADDRDRFDRFGTPGYVAPELLESESVDSKCDIFAAGVLLYELLAGHNPLILAQEQLISHKGRWADYSTAAIPIEPRFSSEKPFSKLVSEFNLTQGLKMPRPPRPLLELLKQMCSVDPSGRPNASEAHSALLRMAEPTKKQVLPFSVHITLPLG